MRRALPWLLLLLAGGARLRAEEEDPLAAPIRAVLLEDDAGLRRTYDAIRKGLELAQLPRVRLEALPDDARAFAEYAARTASSPPPLLFLVGRRAAARAIEAGLGGRRVFVDVAVRAGGRAYPPAPDVAGPAAIVRSVTPAERWGEVVRALLPEGATLAHPAWEEPAARPALEAIAAAAGLRVGGASDAARAWWHLRLGAGEAALPALADGLPVLSDDVGRWAKGAAVLLVPDHRLLGRTAAEAGRRLLLGAPAEVLRAEVGLTEVRVDLAAARATRLHVPLAFLAEADLLRGEPPR